MIDSYAAEAQGRVRVGKFNVDETPGLSARFNIRGVPMLFIFDKGQHRETLPGTLRKHELAAKMMTYTGPV